MAVAIGCSQSPTAYVELGNKFFQEGNFAEASLNYKKALQKDPKFGEAVYRLGLSELRAGNAVTAFQALRQASDMMPEREEVQVSLADLSIASFLTDRSRPKHLYDVVQQVSTRLLAKDPNSAEGLRLRASLLLADRKPNEAIEDFRKALERKPDSTTAAVGLTQALFQAGKAEEAEKLAWSHLEKKHDILLSETLYRQLMAGQRTADAEKVLNARIAAAPRQPAPLIALARHYSRVNKAGEMTATLERLAADPKTFPHAELQVGDFYGSLGRQEDALRHYRKGLAAGPKDTLGYRKRIVNSLIAVNKREEALAEMEALLKERPGDEDALAVQASLWLDSGQPELVAKARAGFEELVKRANTNAVYRFSLGRARLALGDAAGARADFVESARLKTDAPAPRFALAELSLRENRHQEAIRYTEEILKIEQGQPRARLLHARAQLAGGKSLQAREEVNSLLRDHPEYLEAYLELALVSVAEKKFQEAELLIRKLDSASGGKDPRFQAALARTFSEQSRFDDALRLLNDSVKKSPESKLLRGLLAQTAARAGKHDLAIEQYRAVLAGDPKEAAAYQGLGEVYALKGDLPAAIEILQKGEAAAPRQMGVILLLATQLDRAQRRDEAASAYRRALAIQPDFGPALNNLAYLLAETGKNLDEALQLAQRAVAKAPNDPFPSDTLGWVYLKKGVTDSAVQVFTNLVKNHGDNPEFRYHLGAALLQKGDKQGARNELETALGKKPASDLERKIRDLLGRVG